MNEEIKDGDKVRIKEGAKRGQVGEVESLAYLGEDWAGSWVVYLEDGSYAHVTTEEIEKVDDGPSMV